MMAVSQAVANSDSQARFRDHLQIFKDVLRHSEGIIPDSSDTNDFPTIDEDGSEIPCTEASIDDEEFDLKDTVKVSSLFQSSDASVEDPEVPLAVEPTNIDTDEAEDTDKFPNDSIIDIISESNPYEDSISNTSDRDRDESLNIPSMEAIPGLTKLASIQSDFLDGQLQGPKGKEEASATNTPAQLPDNQDEEVETQRPKHRGLREINSMKIQYRRPAIKKKIEKNYNEYRDPSASFLVVSGGEEEDPIQKGTEELNKDSAKSSSRGPLRPWVESADKEHQKTPQVSKNAIEEPILENILNKKVDYVTNYIDDKGIITSLQKKLHLKSKARKTNSRKEVVLASSLKVPKELPLNPEHSKSNETTGLTNSSTSIDSLDAILMSDPTFERQSDEDTAKYIQRVYPRLRYLMEGDLETERQEQTKNTGFFLKVFDGVFHNHADSRDDEVKAHRLLFGSAWNGTIFNYGAETAENNGAIPRKELSSIVGAVVIVIVLIS